MSRGRFVTIGSFDGVHLGHASLLSQTVKSAALHKYKSLALTFSAPPRMLLGQELNLAVLSTPIEKEILLKQAGIDEVQFVNFNKQFSRMGSFAFFKNYLIEHLGAKGLVVGLDFRFGQDRSAGAHELVRWGQKYSIPVWALPQVKKNKHVISSSSIRICFASHHFKKALNLMGHAYVVDGVHVHGKGLGRKIGIPTLNLHIPKEKIMPSGVFVVRGVIRDRLFKSRLKEGSFFYGVANYGVRPTLGETSKKTFEVHVLEGPWQSTSGNYLIEMVSFLRMEKKFMNIDALRRAIDGDIKKAKPLIAQLRQRKRGIYPLQGQANPL